MYAKLKECFMEWWFRTECIFRIYFNISLNGISFSLSILEYNLNFCIEIPCFIPFKFYSIWDRNHKVSLNKFYEEQLSFTSDFITGVEIYWNIHQDHAGFHSFFNLLGLTYSYRFLDRRHWSYTKNRYKIYPDEINKE